MAASFKTIVDKLRSKHDEERLRAAQQLYHYVTNEVQGKPLEFIKTFIEDINQQILQLLQTNSNIDEKKGGLLAIITLISVDVGDRKTQCIKFANILRDLPVATDTALMELEAFTVGKISAASGSLTASYVEYEVTRAIEWLRTDQLDKQLFKKHCAVLRLRELANFAPAFFFQHMNQFFDCIFIAICDQKLWIRDSGVDALRSALYVLVSRETEENQNPRWYDHCYKEAIKNIADPPDINLLSSKDRGIHEDRVHGSLMVLNELFRYSNAECEKVFQNIEDNVLAQGCNDYYFTTSDGTINNVNQNGSNGSRAYSINGITPNSPNQTHQQQSMFASPAYMSGSGGSFHPSLVNLTTSSSPYLNTFLPSTPPQSINLSFMTPLSSSPAPILSSLNTIPYSTTPPTQNQHAHRYAPFSSLARLATSFRHQRRQSQPTSFISNFNGAQSQQPNRNGQYTNHRPSVISLPHGPNILGSNASSNSHLSPHHQHHLSQSSQTMFSSSTMLNPNVPISTRRMTYESPICHQLLSDNFTYICDLVMKQKSSRNPNINHILLILIPRLAAFKPDYFIENHLTETINHLLNGFKSGRERSIFFISIGLLAFGVRDKLRPHLPKIMDSIRNCLSAKDQRQRRSTGPKPVEPSVFICVSLLAQALGHIIEPEIRSQNILDQMTQTGLSPSLASAFLELSIQMPQLRKKIHNHLLEMLSLVLMQKPFSYPGSPNQYGSNTHISTVSALRPTNPVDQPENVHNITLALRILARFDFHSMFTMQFATHCSEHYLTSEIREIRLETVKTCCQLLLPAIIRNQNKYSATLVDSIQNVLHRLLITSVTDTDPEVRYFVLASISQKFDHHLSQETNLDCLFLCLNEEIFEIRELAVCLIGRLSSLNPGYILPRLRKVLLNFVNELKYSGMPRNKEQAARMLGQLFKHAPSLMKAHTEPVISEFLHQLQDNTNYPNATISVLLAIGQQAQVSGIELMKHIDELLVILLQSIQDPTSEIKRDVALWTLGHLIENTGFVVEPYWKYPRLLDILLDLLKTEQAPNIRRKAIRTLGLLGAIDPYRHQVNLGSFGQSHKLLSSASENDLGGISYEISASEMLVNMSDQYDDFYSAIAITSLIKIMKDQSLIQHHTSAVQAVTFIFMRLGVRCVPYIQHVLPTFINVIRNSGSQYGDYYFQQMGCLVSIVKQHIRNYLDDIFELIKESWSAPHPMPTLQMTLINLVEQIVVAPEGEFRVYLPRLIPHALKVFQYDKSPKCVVTERLLNALQQFGNNLDDCLYLILPPIVKCFDSVDMPLSVRKTALETIDIFSESLDLAEHSARILHPLARVLDTEPDLRAVALDTLCAVAFQLGPMYQIFIPIFAKVMSKHKISSTRYDIVENRALRGVHYSDPDEELILRNKRMHKERASNLNKPMQMPEFAANKKIQVSDLQRAWGIRKCATREDWLRWLKILSLDLLKESPSLALRSCNPLAQAHNPLARELFNAAFLCVWAALNEAQQAEFISSIEQALNAPDVPEVTQALLNLTEFMEHSDKGPLPISPQLLAKRAQACRAFAKALHYKEEEFRAAAESGNQSTQVLEDLLSINNKLQHPEAAAGVLKYAENNGYELNNKERWYEKLHDWDNALREYSMKVDQKPDDMDSIRGLLRCYEHIGEWGDLYKLATECWPRFSPRDQQEVARVAASAAWNLRKWNSMDSFTKAMKENTVDSTFYHAVLEVHKENYDLAYEYIDRARSSIDTDLTAMAGESKNRAYGAMVQVMMLSELEEVIQYKLDESRRSFIRDKWWKRLRGCQRIVEDWQKILCLRSLVITPQDDMRGWIKFASLCQSCSNSQCRIKQSHRILTKLLNPNLDGCNPKKVEIKPTDHPQVAFAYLTHMWRSGQREEAFTKLQQFVERAIPKMNCLLVGGNENGHDLGTLDTLTSHNNIISSTSLLNTSTQNSANLVGDMRGNNSSNSTPPVLIVKLGMNPSSAISKDINNHPRLQHLTTVDQIMPRSGYSDHLPSNKLKVDLKVLLSRCYLKLGQWQESLQGVNEQSIPTIYNYYTLATEHDKEWYKAWHALAYMSYEAVLFYKRQSYNVRQYTIPAVKSFFRSIALSHGNSLQDTLRLLTLWFDEANDKEVSEAFAAGVKTVPVETWLQVIPQLIARIDTPRQNVKILLQELLTEVGKYHPQSLIYPLTVASKSIVHERKTAATKIMSSMREHSSNLVAQAMLVSQELIRVAILWHELWHEGLEEASRLYFTEKNVRSMFETLEPLHAMMARGAQTLKEMSFQQAYGRDLLQASDWCKQFQRTDNPKDLTQAWDLYYLVFRRISKQLPQLTSLELKYVSPKLEVCHDLELAVPGSYSPNRPIVQIAKVESSLQVITSKQRPRKLCIKGSDGKEYMFLLKGHEDLRQDERVMQLFGLINTLLMNDPETSRRNLTIQRYAVIPLSTNSGLIGWVPHCDTLHTLIKHYREKRKVMFNIEQRLYLRMTPDFDHLTLMQKVEVFEHALAGTKGDDLARLVWLKSPSSEVWFDRRTNYTRSLATMSMVGYVLGLGDRHPSNLMLDRLTGKVIHIDFGDCFEVAMTREKFPEKIPFRLTRMLINAMEVTGIEGTYRMTCEKMMHVLRKNKDSLMAVLEAFVYDPLLNWALIQGSGVDGHPPEALNAKALAVVNRVRDKLTGRDFDPNVPLDVPKQIDLLIKQATSQENLCQCYIGWCPFW